MHSQIEELGATLVAVSPQLPGNSAKIAKRHKLTFDVLSDAGNAWARDMGLTFTLSGQLRELYEAFPIDLAQYNGDDSWELPIPGRFVVAGDGKIVHQDVDPDYTHRPEPAETVEQLRRLSGVD